MVLERGAVLFDLTSSKYSVSSERGKCLLQLWSAERNIVRRVVDAEIKNGTLRLSVQRLGQPHPSQLEICRDQDRRTPSAKRAVRAAYQHRLQRLLARHFPGFSLGRLSSSIDLERSFGPIYSRGVIRKGRSAFAILGVNADETPASIDAALTFGILWLEVCREAQDGKSVVEGLKLFVPFGHAMATRERIAHLDHDLSKWQLYEFNEAEDVACELDCSDRGNIATRLVHCPDWAAALSRFSVPIKQVLSLMPEAEVAVLSPAEVAFRLHGLEFARARVAHDSRSVETAQEIVFGIGAEEQILTPDTWSAFQQLMAEIGEVRHPEGPRDHPLFRLSPERWLESLVMQNVGAIDERLDRGFVYSQVPAFSSADRGMIDVLTATISGRLAVVELKADEDIHLPLQGIDYWSRVVWHLKRGEFQSFGYFAGRELSTEDPWLLFVAPAFHVHPATDTVLRYIRSSVCWTLIGVDEHWRHGVKVVFRKRPGDLRGRRELISAIAAT
jgi:hypothetical protein